MANAIAASILLPNSLPWSLRRSISFYAPLLNNLDCLGVDSPTFTRASASNALWRDGTSHAVAANIPRFEWLSATTPGGMALNTATESLQFAPGNNLSSGNSLFWVADGTQHWSAPETNPFNGSGVWTGTSGIHLSHVLKFSRVLSADEKNKVQVAFGGVATQTPEPGVITFRLGVSAGALSTTITHNAHTTNYRIFAIPNWATIVYWGTKGTDSVPLYFTVQAPADGSGVIEGSIE